MPAQTPTLHLENLRALQALGARLRARREQLGISAVAAAESAGMSRWSWSRIEAGEPSVTMGAYLSAASAMGLALDLRDPARDAQAATAPAEPPLEPVELKRYPQLQRLAWQMPGVTALSARDALSLYERNWRHVDATALEPQERALVAALVKRAGGGRLLV